MKRFVIVILLFLFVLSLTSAFAQSRKPQFEVFGGVTRPPMNPTAETLSLCNEICQLAERIQVPIHWTATGGGADGSFTAMHGVPTIDGIGPVSGDAHSEREFMVIDSIEPRYRLAKEIIYHIIQRRTKL